MIYIMARCMLAIYAFVDRQDGIGDAFSHSWRITRGNLLRIYATVFCGYIPAIPFAIFAMGTPWYYLAAQLCGIIMGLSITYAYRQLSPEEEIEIF
jgi:hypothetical protein